MPIKRDWNHSPNSGPKSISISLGSRSVITEEMSMDASELIIPAACATTLCAISKTPITIFHVFVTRSMAVADLNTHLKIIQVSTSCRLFLSAIIWIRSTVITIARITPAIGTMMEFDRFSIILKILPFHPCGVCPTNLHGYISDLLVYRIEHPGQVAHNAAYQHFFQPIRQGFK